MRKNWPEVILVFILVLAFSLRIIALERFPAGFTADEAAQGYTAYSILRTGKDEWGVRLPLTPRSFGDYKLPLYTYLAIPSIAIFGLNELAVRLPNAVLGSLGVLGVYLLVKELLLSFPLALLASLLLAISPWHISLSRGAFEANLTTFFIPLAFWLFLKGLKKAKHLTLAGLLFGLNLFTYHAARFFTPLFFAFLFFWKRKKAVWSGLIFVPFLIVAFYSTLAGGTRVADIGIFSAGWQAPKIFLDNYLSYFSPQFLFTQGAGEATYGMIPGRGVLYLFELPLLIFALFSLVKKRNDNFSPLLAWLILAPIPAALSLGVGYHANRVATMMPAIQVLSAYGFFLFWQRLSRWIFWSLCFLMVLSCLFFLKDYFLIAPKINAPAMAYGWQEAMEYIKAQESNYEKIIISRRFSESQAFVAFYSQYNPNKFQQESQDWLRYEEEGFLFVDQLGQYSLGKYEFRNLNFPDDKELVGALLVGRPEEFPVNTSVQKMIIYPSGERAFFHC